MSITAYNIVDQFEKTIASYAGSKYAVAVESCCAAIFLCLVYKKAKNVWLPKFTYPGVACSVIHAGAKNIFDNRKWKGIYELRPHGIIDGALRFREGMYGKETLQRSPLKLHCLSFHAKKLLPIGRGGMILCDYEDSYNWFKKARFDGRNEGVNLSEDNIGMVGWNMYMTPEQAARGLMIFDLIKNKDLADLEMSEQGYPDLSKIKVYQ